MYLSVGKLQVLLFLHSGFFLADYAGDVGAKISALPPAVFGIRSEPQVVLGSQLPDHL
jgi:hypothetical protein